ncbi:hypothetical protein CDAR_267531 [Caerostris darwini]|uniref:Uncharacterized protein n=1 Tax=Caerostris darwini TaxID=1538125 RepID=A0AAV4TFD9_9ARAC|nr:hypothetical protein CDAR_267531 [Caerostris darwini]
MIEIGGNLRARDLVSMVDMVDLTCSDNFCRVVKETGGRTFPDETCRASGLLFVNLFVRLLPLILLNGSNTFLKLLYRCLIKTHNSGFLSNPTRERA